MIKELILYFIFEKLKFKIFVPWKCEICGCGKRKHHLVTNPDNFIIVPKLICEEHGWCL